MRLDKWIASPDPIPGPGRRCAPSSGVGRSRCFSKQDWAFPLLSWAFPGFLTFLRAFFNKIERSSLKSHFFKPSRAFSVPEAINTIIRVATPCTSNKCAFCRNLYKRVEVFACFYQGRRLKSYLPMAR